MATYEKVTYRPEGQRARTVYLRDPKVTSTSAGPLLVGREVDRDGNAVLDGAGSAAIERTHVIEESLVVKRVPVRMSLLYGCFVPEEDS